MKSMVTDADTLLMRRLAGCASVEDLPLSFVYDGASVHGMPAAFSPAVETRMPDSRLICTSITGRDERGLEIRVECTVYRDYPAVEWIAFFTNRAQQDSAVLSDVLPFDALVPIENARLTHSNGDTLHDNGYEEWTDPVQEGMLLAPTDGTSCNGAFPYFRLLNEEQGLNVAVGWPAMWKAAFSPEDGGVRLQIGQLRCHMRLHPGETMRTPRVTLVAYTGDETRGMNMWRRWYIDHILPRENGAPLPPKCCMHVFGTEGKPEFTGANEENQLRGIAAYLSRGVRPDIWWIDAGWYPCQYEWPRIGTWKPSERRFPSGLGPIGRACAQNGMQLLLWFEPERVRPDTELYTRHPEWLLHIADQEGRENENSLLNLGDRDCCDFLIERVNAIIQDSGVRVYRQDFNFNPKPYWEAAEAPDRIGAVENQHVQGYLRFWDSLLLRNPGLWIDSCASGGRRNDLETLRRAVPLHYTDVGYGNHPIKQKQHRLMFAWIPYFRAHNMNWDDPETGAYGSENRPADHYAYYAAMAPALTDMLEWDADEEAFALARQMQPIWRRAAGMMLSCDYYPLTECRKSAADYYAMQFHDPDAGTGFVEIMRNNACAQPTFCLKMRALQKDAHYCLTNAETGAQLRLCGADLLSGVDFALPLRSGAIYFYEQLPD